MLSSTDIDQVKGRGSDPDQVKEQIQYFIDGFPFLSLSKAATVGNGVIRLTDDEAKSYADAFDQKATEGEINLLKFVPASGAATRMFKSLFSFLESGKTDKSVEEFFEKLNSFAFYSSLSKSLATDGIDIDTADRQTIADYFLTDKGLGYGNLPKGLLRFHRYDQRARTPLEEHMIEGVHYANAGGGVRLHFTVSPEHRDKFEKLVVESLPGYESEFGVKFYISFSEQKASTDTIAVNPDNSPFREKDGSLLFRPAGHGALIENLNSLEADIIFTKNVDNVVPDRLKETTVLYKKALAGLLLDYQQRIFNYLEKLDTDPSEQLVDEIEPFLANELNILPPSDYTSFNLEKKIAYQQDKLHRPLRICGMVKNEGEPGGGPFWAVNADGTTSLQIVESAQVNLDDPEQSAIFRNSTHFNPVDLVCAPRNRNNENFNLTDYRDPKTGFISYKSKDGKDLKAQELPGLWNGAMANWITLFVEVPLITFNPVKTVNDLLRDQHQ